MHESRALVRILHAGGRRQPSSPSSSPTSRPPRFRCCPPISARRSGATSWPLLMMSFLRRLVLKAVIAAKKPSVMAAAGTLQHGVGCQDGAKDVQIRPILRRSGPIPHPGSSRPQGSLPKRQPTIHASQLDGATLNWPRSSPDGTRAPPRTACTTTGHVHTSTPAAESTRDARSHHAGSRQPSNPSRDSSSPEPTACWTASPSSGPTWTTGISGASHKTTKPPSSSSPAPLEQSILNRSPARSKSRRLRVRTPSRHPR